MTQTTPNLSLTKPGGGSTGTNTPPDRVDIDVLNDNFDKIDVAVGDPDEQNRQWYGPAAGITTIPVAPKDGDTYQESDGNKILWKRVGGVWVTGENGMYLLRPTIAAGTGVTVGANGHINFGTTGDSFRVDNIFTSRFRRYKLLFDWSVAGGANGSQLFFATGGVPNSSTSYWNQLNYAAGSSLSGSFINDPHIPVSPINALYHAVELDVWAPASAEITKWRIAAWSNGGGGGLSHRGGDFESSAVFDGFRFTLSTTGGGRLFSGGDMAIYGLA